MGTCYSILSIRRYRLCIRLINDENNRIEEIRAITDRFIRDERRDFYGYKLVRHAVCANRMDVLQMLAVAGFALRNHRKDMKYGSILHVATEINNLAIVTLLVGEYGFNVNIQDNWNFTPLHVAAANNSLEVLEFLVGQDRGIINNTDMFGNTPLNWAIQTRAQRCLTYLRQNAGNESIFSQPRGLPDEHLMNRFNQQRYDGA